MIRSCRWVLWVALFSMVSACSGETGEISDPAGEPLGCAGYEERGGFEVGVTTLQMAGVPVEVWYPAADGATNGLARDVYDMRQWLPADEAGKIPDDATPLFEMDAYRDVAAADGSFPLVLFSHGMGGYRMQSSTLMTHLASWGFVVAAPEHPERGLAVLVADGVPSGDNGPQAMLDTLALMRSENSAAGGPLAGRIDFDRVAVSGHSAGGGAVLEVAGEAVFDTWITLASGGFGTGGGPEIPSLMMAGTNDQIAVANQVEGAFDRQAADKRYVAVAKMGHLGFSDICAIGADRGGVLQIAEDYGVEVPEILSVLGRDGCTEMDLAPEAGWPVVNHYVTAHLKHVFGVNADPVGLEDESTSCFGERVATYKHD